MQAVVKTHHINIHIEADRIPNSLLTLLKNEYGNDLKIIKKRKTKREEFLLVFPNQYLSECLSQQVQRQLTHQQLYEYLIWAFQSLMQP